MTDRLTHELMKPRSPVVGLAADQAARGLGVGKPCPVCGDTLTALSTKNAEALTFVDALLRHGIGGLVADYWLQKRTSCECAKCETVFRGIPTLETILATVALSLFVGAFVGLIGVKEIANAQGGRLIASFLLIVLACLSPVYAWFVVTRPSKRLALRITRARERWAESAAERAIEVDGEALLEQARPGASCPVCARGKLEGSSPNPIWERGGLVCTVCKVEVPALLTPVGSIAGTVVSLGLIALGASLVWAARDVTAGGVTGLRAALGLVIAIGGVYGVFLVQGTGDDLARRELARARGRLERRRLGLPTRDDDEEPAVWFQENLEAVVVAFILALVIRHFVMEAFVIPTGSMAPTLLGDHFRVQCKNCGYPFDVQKIEGRISDRGEDVRARCPLCGVNDNDNAFTFFERDVRGGNKILVNKFIYKIERPERYQVVVFKYPKNPTRNFIKRLIGLPGDTIKIDQRGDILVKAPTGSSFELARKPRSVQEELWMPVYDARWPDPRGTPWKDPESTARWETRREPSGEVEVARSGSNDAWLYYGRDPNGKNIQDWYGYNKGWQQAKPVGDVRLRARVTPGAGAKSIKLALVENERALVATIPVGSGDTATIGSYSPSTAAGFDTAKSGKCRPIPAGSATEVSLAYADERATLTVAGEDVIVWDDPQAPAYTETSSVRLGADAGGATFADVRIDRDIFYVSGGSHREFDPTYEPVTVPPDCYFMMGDNSPNSQDGREWGFVHEPHLIGRAFLVFWPLDEVKLIR